MSRKFVSRYVRRNENETPADRAARRTANATVVLTVVTGLLLIIAALTFYEVVEGGNDTHRLSEATLIASRAWVAPEQIILGSPTEAGLPLHYQVRIVNTGKEPALGLVWYVRPLGTPYISEGQRDYLNLGDNNSCSKLEPDSKRGTVLYPAGSTNFWLPLNVADTAENKLLLEAVNRRQETLIIEGCFAYIASTQRHTSAFRFFLRDVPGDSFVAEKGGEKVPNWQFNFTLDGNQAN